MGNISKNLSRYEFLCACGCGDDTVDFGLVDVLQGTANHFEKEHGKDNIRIDILSGNRCREHNDNLRKEYRNSGGKYGFDTAENSLHVFNRAADFKLTIRSTGKQIPPTEVYDYLDRKYGRKIALGLYLNRVHVDNRTRAGQRFGIKR
jgi:hypothetical protein